MLPERIKICSAVKVEGILLSYSLIGNPAHVRVFGKFSNLVFGSIILPSNAAAKVKVLNTDPNS